jgi:hypothetical protein
MPCSSSWSSGEAGASRGAPNDVRVLRGAIGPRCGPAVQLISHRVTPCYRGFRLWGPRPRRLPGAATPRHWPASLIHSGFGRLQGGTPAAEANSTDTRTRKSQTFSRPQRTSAGEAAWTRRASGEGASRAVAGRSPWILAMRLPRCRPRRAGRARAISPPACRRRDSRERVKPLLGLRPLAICRRRRGVGCGRMPQRKPQRC